MTPHQPNLRDAFVTRRDFLSQCGMGMGALSLAALFGETGLLAPSALATEIHAVLSVPATAADPEPIVAEPFGDPDPTPSSTT